MWAAAWLAPLLARANLADACLIALLLVFFWVDVAKASFCVRSIDRLVRCELLL